MTTSNQLDSVPLAPGLYRDENGSLSLLGSRCRDCGEHFFPRQQACTACSRQDLEAVDLGSRGTLWTWTIQAYRPKAPYLAADEAQPFVPYGVGYVELPCGLKVESRLVEADPDRLRIGMPMRLAILPFAQRAQDGQTLSTFHFVAEDSL